ncbi:MAG TPA: hypothetical protein VIM29_13320 [Bacillota bacterium]
MIWFIKLVHDFRTKIRQERKFKAVLVLLGLLLLLKLTELGLNLWVRQALRESLGETADSTTRLELKLEWLSLADLIAGRIRKIDLTGYRCTVGGIELQRLRVVSDGFRLDLNSLLQERDLYFKLMAPTEITAEISQTVATRYFREKYPHFKPKIGFVPERLQLSGAAKVLDQEVPLFLEGQLQIIQPKTVRFFPEHLEISGREVPSEFLKFIANQFPLEVMVLPTWPLQLKGLTLREGVLSLAIREIPL